MARAYGPNSSGSNNENQSSGVNKTPIIIGCVAVVVVVGIIIAIIASSGNKDESSDTSSLPDNSSAAVIDAETAEHEPADEPVTESVESQDTPSYALDDTIDLTGSNVVPIVTDPSVLAPSEDNIVVEEEYILNEDEETEEQSEPTEAESQQTIYSEDLDVVEAHPVIPSYENTDNSRYAGPIDKTFDWDALSDQNNDIMAWLYVPGTAINYPILREDISDNDYYYATHDINGNEIISASVFSPVVSDDDAHFLILGHNMRNDTMFGTLDYYKNSSFSSSNPYIYVYYPDRAEKWQVWTAYQTLVGDIIYDMPYQFGSVEYEALLTSMSNNAKYVTAAQAPSVNERVLTLSTCDNFDGEHQGRFVVNAVLVETKTY